MFGFKRFKPETPEQRQETATARERLAAERAELDAARQEEAEKIRLARLAKEEADRQAAEILEAEIRANSKWKYSEHQDGMRGTTTHVASLVSNNVVEFPFPYDGGSSGIITIRKIGQEVDLIFQITKGQFQFGRMIYIISTKADNGPVLEWSGSRAANGVTSMMFLTQVEPIIRAISGSKKFIVEANFYNSGLRQFVFNPEGLDRRFRV